MRSLEPGETSLLEKTVDIGIGGAITLPGGLKAGGTLSFGITTTKTLTATFRCTYKAVDAASAADCCPTCVDAAFHEAPLPVTVMYPDPLEPIGYALEERIVCAQPLSRATQRMRIAEPVCWVDHTETVDLLHASLDLSLSGSVGPVSLTWKSRVVSFAHQRICALTCEPGCAFTPRFSGRPGELQLCRGRATRFDLNVSDADGGDTIQAVEAAGSPVDGISVSVDYASSDSTATVFVRAGDSAPSRGEIVFLAEDQCGHVGTLAISFRVVDVPPVRVEVVGVEPADDDPFACGRNERGALIRLRVVNSGDRRTEASVLCTAEFGRVVPSRQVGPNLMVVHVDPGESSPPFVRYYCPEPGITTDVLTIQIKDLQTGETADEQEFILALAPDRSVEWIDATDPTHGNTARRAPRGSVANAPPQGEDTYSRVLAYQSTGPAYYVMDPAWYDTGCLTFMDPDGDDLSIRVGRPPRLGSLDTITHGNRGTSFVSLMYRIDADEALAAHRGMSPYVDRFSIVATDPHGASAATDVTITVDVLNTPPSCGDDEIVTGVEQPIFIPVLSNDTDADRDLLVLHTVTDPSNGTAMINEGTILYTPAVGYFGEDSFTYTVLDGHGGEASGAVAVQVVDTTPPVFLHPPSGPNAPSSDPGICGAWVSWTDPVIGQDVIDNVGISGLTSSHASNGTFIPVDTPTTITYTATDFSGNQAIAAFEVEVIDREPPSIAGIPSGITATLPDSSSEGPVFWTAPTAVDNCELQSLESTHVPGETFAEGETKVTYTATDIHGNSATASFDVIVFPALALDCEDMTVWAHGDETDPVDLTVQATGGCSPIEYAFAPPSGTRFPVGETTPVFCTATDACGSETTCTFNVIARLWNQTPQANDDAATANDGVCCVDVLENDHDPDGDDLLVTGVSQGACGDAIVDADGRRIHFVAMGCALYQGSEISIEYVVEDPFSASDTGTLRVWIPATGPLPQSTEPDDR